MSTGRQTPTDGVVAVVEDLIAQSLARRATDLHFEPTDAGLRVRARVDSQLFEQANIPGELAGHVVARLKVLAELLTYRIDIPQEGSLAMTDAGGAPLDVRVSTFPTIRGERVVLRFLARRPQVESLAELGLSAAMTERLASAVRGGSGLLLVVGPAGSGKTTTLYALLRLLQSERPRSSLITIEDPVEYRLDGVTQIQVQPHRELTYARVLRGLLRQDPETILLGEIRDAETAHVAAEAALTGHLILSTLHGGSPGEAILRLLEMGLPSYQVTSGLQLVASQRLLRVLCPACRRPNDDVNEPWSAGGCAECLGSGYRGRTACGEWTEMSTALREAILQGGDATALQQASHGAARHDLSDDALRHVRAGRTTLTEVRRALG